MIVVFVVVLLLLARWLVWEFGRARRNRIGTHAYHQHKKTRGRAHRQPRVGHRVVRIGP